VPDSKKISGLIRVHEGRVIVGGFVTDRGIEKKEQHWYVGSISMPVDVFFEALSELFMKVSDDKSR
jgi:hypothetical protein